MWKIFYGETALPCWVTFQGLCSSRWEGEHCSLPGNICTLALPIAAAAPSSEEPRRRTRVLFCTCTCWGAPAVEAGWYLALHVRASFPSLSLPRLWAQLDLGHSWIWGTAAPLPELPWCSSPSGWCPAAEGCYQHRNHCWGWGDVRDPVTFAGNWKHVRNRSSI